MFVLKLNHCYTSIGSPMMQPNQMLHMMTQGIRNAVHTGPLLGESTGHRWVPFTKGQQHGTLIFLAVRLNILLNNQSSCRWLEKPWRIWDVAVLRKKIWLTLPRHQGFSRSALFHTVPVFFSEMKPGVFDRDIKIRHGTINASPPPSATYM